MKETVKIIKVSAIDDYYVKVLVNDLVLEAMVASLPYKIKEGGEYQALFSFTNFDDCILKPADIYTKQLNHIKNYSYEVRGLLINNDTVDVGINISSDFLENNLYLVETYVEFQIDRLEIHFI